MKDFKQEWARRGARPTGRGKGRFQLIPVFYSFDRKDV